MSRAYSQPAAGHSQYGSQPEAEAHPDGGSAEAGQDGGGDGSDGQGGGPPEEEEFECPNNGIFADEPSGCQAYHVCQSGAQVQQRFQCPLGTLFNNIILTCDFAHNVQCGGKKAASNQQQPGAQGRPEAQELHESLQQPPRPAPRTPDKQVGYPEPQDRRQQQARWSPVQNQQQQQPRQLQIGQSQYNKHSQAQTSQAQAVNTYPQSRPVHSDSAENSKEADSDDERPEPLVPATLPPRPAQQQYQQQYQQRHQQQQPAQLPYNAPPARQLPQSAHRSQYPSANEAYNSNYGDSASLATPVYLNQNDPKQVSNNFNMVINHVAPATSPAKSTQRPASQQQQQHVSVAVAPSHGQRNQRVHSTGATQPKPVHADPGSTATAAKSARRGVVDLTNDSRASSSVSSEALNNGLLLIVRHQSEQSESRREPARQSNKQGQAYALDPKLVKPNSPVDAQLFPNVQKFISQASRANFGNQLSASTNSPVSQRQQTNSVISLPLPALEPPKPQVQEEHQGELQLVASSVTAADKVQVKPKNSKTESQQQAVKKVKRAKRLKANPQQQQQSAKQELSKLPAKKIQITESRSSLVIHEHKRQSSEEATSGGSNRS